MLLAIPASGCESSDSAATTACVTAAPEALRVCIGELNAAVEACYESSDAPCESDDLSITAALATLAQTVESNCTDADFGSLSVDALVGRLQNACSSESSSLAWRTYGGPQGAVWPEASNDEQACLASAHQSISTMVDGALAAINSCLASGECTDAAVAAEREALAESAVSEIEAACQDLAALIAVSPATYVDRAVHQVDCITATGHADTGSLALSCGPSNVDFEAPRGEYVQVVVDGEKWGTLCGDGTPYAFQVRLAPEGERLDRIIIGLEGAGYAPSKRIAALAWRAIPNSSMPSTTSRPPPVGSPRTIQQRAPSPTGRRSSCPTATRTSSPGPA